MQVDVSGYRFENPDMCACCGGNPETKMPVTARRKTGKRVVHETTNSYAFPYCTACLEHVKAANTAIAVTVFIVAVFLLAAGYFYFFATISDFAIFMIIGAVVGGAIAYSGLISRAKSLCVSNCSCVGCAVEYLGWDGPVQKFEIASQSYALAFRVDNQKKLVNVSHENWQELQALNFIKHPSKQESIIRSKR